ncbi:F-box/WD repeat-containing protein [Endozoicomonas sp. 2B-B]
MLTARIDRSQITTWEEQGMQGIDNNASIAESEPPPTRQTHLGSTLFCISAGRSVAKAYEEEKDSPSFQYFSVLSSPMIFRYLKLRDIVSLERVCSRLRDGIKQDNALAKAWYRRFPSLHQYQLRTAINTKNKEQLRGWLESFTNDQVLVNSLTDLNPKAVYAPALFFFTKAKLMSECKTFKLITTSTITENEYVNSASLSVDGRHLITASDDDNARIYVHKTDGAWAENTVIRHRGPVESATFSPDGQHVVTASCDGKAKIYCHKADGSWEPVASISHRDSVNYAAFSPDGRHVVTASSDLKAKVYSLRDDGSWESIATIPQYGSIRFANFSPDARNIVTDSEYYTAEICGFRDDGSRLEEASIDHDGWVVSATFSPDGRHVATASKDGTAKICGQKADKSWEPEETICHSACVNSANFSPDSRYVVTASDDKTVKIYGRKADGSWQPEANIVHKREVLSAAFGPDGCHVVTASRDGTAKIIGKNADGSWLEKVSISHNTGIPRNNDWIISASFSTDGRYVLTVANDYSVKITELRRSDLLPAAPPLSMSSCIIL